VRIAAGLNHNVVAADDGKVFTWGHGGLGQLGLDTQSESKMTPCCVLLPEEVKIVDVAAGDGHTLALSENGHLYGWGHTEYFQLGRKYFTGDAADGEFHRALPFRMVGFEGIQSVHAGGAFSLCMMDNQLVSWGWNTKKQLGQGATLTYQYGVTPKPVKFSAMPAHDRLRFTSVGCGMEFAACVVEPDSSVRHLRIWGPRNRYLAAHQHVGADVVINALDGNLGCHRQVLAVRCPELCSMISNGSISMLNYCKNSVAALLDYIYCDHDIGFSADHAELEKLCTSLRLPRLLAMFHGAAAFTTKTGEGQYVKKGGKWVMEETAGNSAAKAGEETGGSTLCAIPATTFYKDMQCLQASGDSPSFYALLKKKAMNLLGVICFVKWNIFALCWGPAFLKRHCRRLLSMLIVLQLAELPYASFIQGIVGRMFILLLIPDKL